MTRSLIRAAACAVVVVGPLTAQVAAKQIGDAVTCATCTVTVQHLVKLGAEDGPGSLPGSVPSVRVDARGRYWVFHEGELPMVFAPDGRFVMSLGRKGEGPGEFRSAYDALFLPGDSIAVHDFTRISIFDGALSFVRTIPIPPEIGRGFVVNWPSLVIANNGRIRVRGDPALLQVSFSTSPATVTGRFAALADHPSPYGGRLGSMTEVTGGRFWAFDVERYWLGQWTTDGKMVAALHRQSGLFANPPFESGKSVARPSVRSISADAAGRIWVAVNVAKPGWKEGMPKLAPGVIEIASRSIAFERLFRTMIEVLDPRTGTVVARKDLNEWVVALLPDGRAATYGVDVAGTPSISIVRLTLQGR